MTERTISVTLSILCKTESEAVHTMEALSRTAAGLAFEGLYASVSIHEVPEESLSPGAVEGSTRPNSPARLWRRWRARDWRCRCGRRVFGDPGKCEWHASVRRGVLAGKIRNAEDAR